MPTALVTGVSRGLGLCITQALKDAGYRVLGVGLAASPHNGALDDYRQVDVGDKMDEIPFANHDVDVLVNNAAVYLDDPRGDYGDVFCLDIDHLRRTLDVNFVGPTSLALGHVPGMVRRGSGRLVNVSSGMGRLLDADGTALAYRVSKLAINTLTLSIAHHFARSGGNLAAFSYCPGSIKTSMGTERAPGEVEPSAQALVDLLPLPPESLNGKFFRLGRELGWDVADPAPLGQPRRRDR